MTYALAAPLQAAVFGRLAAHAPLAALVGTAIHDALPPGPLPSLYVALGPEAARDRSDQSGRGAEHDLVLSVVSDAAGFASAKAVAAAVCDALLAPGLALSRGRLVLLTFVRARAARDGAARRVDLTFRARVEDAGL